MSFFTINFLYICGVKLVWSESFPAMLKLIQLNSTKSTLNASWVVTVL